MSKNLNPVVLMNGDESARDGAEMVRDIVFEGFPFIDADTGVEARLKSNDRCIEEAAEAVREYGGGIKISTASNHADIKAKGWKSANIRLRPLAGCFGMYRQTFKPGNYKKPVATYRFGSGDFYAEQGCVHQVIDGKKTAIITQHFITEFLEPYAKIALERATAIKAQLVYASKWTISDGEKLLPDACKKIWNAAGLTEGKWRGDGDYYGEITDMCGAFLPTNVTFGDGTAPMSGDNGGFIICTGNGNGDTFGDIMDFQHGKGKMGSEVTCMAPNGKIFSYEESPGGTAPGRYGSNYKGDKYFTPSDTLYSFCTMVSRANPDQKEFCDAALAALDDYHAQEDPANYSTEEALRFVRKQATAS